MTIRLRSSSNTEIRIRPQLQTWPSLSDAGFGVHPKFGGIGVPVVQTNFTTTSSLPSWISFSRTSNATLYDSTGKLTYAPNNLLLNTATLSTQSVTTAAINYILSFSGTGSVALSGAYTGNLAGTGASNRVSLAFTSTAASLTLTVTGSVTSAQLEAVTYQTTPSTYVATTTAAYYGPRFDYDPSTLAAKGLLIEEQRVNILTYSEQFNNAAWTKSAATITANATTSPDGTSSADKLVDDTTATTAHYVTRSGIIVTNATAYTLTVYAKAAGRNFVVVQLGSAYAWFNLSTGAIGTTVPATTGTFAISNVGNGWYRCSVTWTTTSTTTFATIYNASANNVFNYTGDGVSGVFIWGAQLEAGSFATSYIPTTSASVTRAADVAQLTGSALTVAGANTGSAIVQTTAWLNSTAAARDLLSSATTRRLLYSNSSNTVLSSTDGTTGLNATIGGSGTFTGGAVRSAIGWTSSGRSLVANNGTLTSDSVNLSTGATVTLGGYGSTTTFDGWIASVALYNQRLPDAILKQKSAVGAPY